MNQNTEVNRLTSTNDLLRSITDKETEEKIQLNKTLHKKVNKCRKSKWVNRGQGQGSEGLT